MWGKYLEGIKKQTILSVMSERNGSLKKWLKLPRWWVRKNSDVVVFGGEKIETEGRYKEAKFFITEGSWMTVSRIDQPKTTV